MKCQHSFNRPCRTQHRTLRQQRGVSLVELMVGITIGLLVSIAAVGTLVYNRVAATTVSDTVRLQQDAATIMRVIGRQLKQAGAVPVVESGFGKFKYLSTYSGIAGAVPAATSPVSVSGTNGAQDVLSVSYSVTPNGAAGVSNCFGQTPDATATNITSTFQILAGSFRCSTPVTGAAAAQNQPFLDNVEDLQFWYAVRVAGVIPSQIQYRAADAVADWTAVEAVQVCVRMAGTTTNNPTGGQVTVGCNNENVVDDGRIRRVFRQVFSLRNLQSLS